MSFVSRFNLTASVIHIVTYGRVKHPPIGCVEDISSGSERRLVLERISVLWL